MRLQPGPQAFEAPEMQIGEPSAARAGTSRPHLRHNQACPNARCARGIGNAAPGARTLCPPSRGGRVTPERKTGCRRAEFALPGSMPPADSQEAIACDFVPLSGAQTSAQGSFLNGSRPDALANPLGRLGKELQNHDARQDQTQPAQSRHIQGLVEQKPRCDRNQGQARP